MDTKQLLVECITFEADQVLLKEAIDHPNQPFKVAGILQRKGRKNQNGRIYPDEVLEREVGKYLNTFIAERRAMGELDHPESCLTQFGQILTKSGWKYIKDISDIEEVLTLNIETNKPEYQVITKKIDQAYKGEMYHIHGKNIDTTVTPNHRFVIEDRYGKLSLKTAKELYELNNIKNTHLKIPKSNLMWECESQEKFILKGDIQTKYLNDIEIDFNVWMSFIGLYLSEGHCTTSRRDGNKSKISSFGVHISQNSGEKCDKIRTLLSKFPDSIKWNETKKKSGKSIIFSVSDARLWNYVSVLRSCYDKYIPIELKNQSASLLECLLEWFHLGDGRTVNDRGYTVKNVFSVSNKLIEDLQEIQLKCGRNGNITIQESKQDYKYSDHIIRVFDKSPLYVLKFNKSNYIHIDNRFISIEKIDYNDRIYCVSVPNQTFYCRDQGKCYWSGNSVVNLKNVSHNVVEMHWQGDDLVGTVEVLTTPNGNILRELFRNGIRLGISSRGLGTLKKSVQEGTAIVGDDFELIAFDFVSNPSTQGAFMAPSGQVPIAENVVKNPTTNRWERVDEIVRNILSELG